MQSSGGLGLTQALTVPQGTKQVMEGKVVQQNSLWSVTGTMFSLPDPLNTSLGLMSNNIPLSPSYYLGFRLVVWTPSLQAHFQQTLGGQKPQEGEDPSRMQVWRTHLL